MLDTDYDNFAIVYSCVGFGGMIPGRTGSSFDLLIAFKESRLKDASYIYVTIFCSLFRCDRRDVRPHYNAC